jgi:hypothetical protein
MAQIGLESDSCCESGNCSICWDFAGVEGRPRSAALGQPGCAGAPKNNVAGVHAVGGGGCQAPSVGYGQLAGPCGPGSGGRYSVGLAEENGAC